MTGSDFRTILGLSALTFAFGFAMARAHTAYVRARRVGGTPPAWLARLERLRQDLANEPPNDRPG